MGHARVDAHHEVQARHERGKAVEVVAHVEGGEAGQPVAIVACERLAFALERDELDVVDCQHGRECPQRQAALQVVRVAGRARPCHTHVQAAPARGNLGGGRGLELRIGAKIRLRARHVLQAEVEQVRQREQRHVHVVGRQRVALDDHVGHAGDGGGEPRERRRDDDDRVRAARGEWLDEAQVLEAVTQALLGGHEEAASARGIACPAGTGMAFERGGELGRAQPPFVLAPAGSRIATQQKGEGAVPVQLRVVGAGVQSPIEGSERTGHVAALLTCEAEVAPCAGVTGMQSERALVGGDSLVAASRGRERQAAVVVELGLVGHQRHRAVEVLEGFVEPTLLIADHAEVVQGQRMVRPEREGTLIRVLCLFEVAAGMGFDAVAREVVGGGRSDGGAGVRGGKEALRRGVGGHGRSRPARVGAVAMFVATAAAAWAGIVATGRRGGGRHRAQIVAGEAGVPAGASFPLVFGGRVPIYRFTAQSGC